MTDFLYSNYRRALASAASTPPSLDVAAVAALIAHRLERREMVHLWMQHVIVGLGAIPTEDMVTKLSNVAGVNRDFASRLVRSFLAPEGGGLTCVLYN